jgi:hypothetical protein
MFPFVNRDLLELRIFLVRIEKKLLSLHGARSSMA